MSNPADFKAAYLQQQVANASPLQQLIMLLDGVSRFVSRAKEAIALGDIQERHNCNRRAMEIIAHLLGMIDVSAGGEAAVRLRRIYGYLLRRLSDIDFKNDPTVCDEVLGHLKTMRDAWATMEQPSTVVPLAPKPTSAEPQIDPASIIRRSAVA